jgi:hypothetical protein
VRRLLATIPLAALLIVAAPASARDPGRWILTGYSSVSISYWQGVSSPPDARQVFFSGLAQGLYRTAPSLRERAALGTAIPATVLATEGYNHVGDISWHRGEGGRVLLPLECYSPGAPGGSNTCGTGSIGVADPSTLAFRYYVKLDPAEIPKAMWVEASPDGKLLWTSSGRDLLAYRAADVSAAHAAPAGAPIRSVRRLAGAVPPSGVAGAAFRGGRLFLAGATGGTYQVWSVDTRSGTRRLEVELPSVQGEAEGLHTMRLLNGELHWLIGPLALEPTFGPTVGLLHFLPARGRPGLRLSARATAALTTRPRVSVRVTRRGTPVSGATVTLAGARKRTDAGGRVTLLPRLEVPGRYAALARWRGLRGITKRFRLGYGDTRR